MKKILIFIFCCFLPFGSYAQDESQVSQFKQTTPQTKPEPKQRQPNVDIWLPPDFQSSEQKWPLIIFSHGFGGCGNQSKFLTSYLADNGYIVIAPDHADANCSKSWGGFGSKLQDMRSGKQGRPERPFRNPDYWTDETEKDRADDVLFALSSMLDDRMYKNYIDVDKIGLMGHSLGGYTVLGLAGGWKSWKDKRFKAVLALSPYIDPYVVSHRLSHVNVPVMYQGGTKDVGVTPSLKQKNGGGYNHSKPPKYFIELDGADHFAWTERDKEYQNIIQKTSLQFFDKYLKDASVDIDYKTGKDQIKTFWKDEGLSPNDKKR